MPDTWNLSNIAASMLSEEFIGIDPKTAPEADIKAACERFTTRWTAAASAAIPIYLAEVYHND